MSAARTASRILTRTAADLEQLLGSERGPDPWQLRQVVDQLYDAAGLLMASAADIEQGLVD